MRAAALPVGLGLALLALPTAHALVIDVDAPRARIPADKETALGVRARTGVQDACAPVSTFEFRVTGANSNPVRATLAPTSAQGSPNGSNPAVLEANSTLKLQPNPTQALAFQQYSVTVEVTVAPCSGTQVERATKAATFIIDYRPGFSAVTEAPNKTVVGGGFGFFDLLVTNDANADLRVQFAFQHLEGLRVREHPLGESTLDAGPYGQRHYRQSFYVALDRVGSARFAIWANATPTQAPADHNGSESVRTDFHFEVLPRRFLSAGGDVALAAGVTSFSFARRRRR